MRLRNHWPFPAWCGFQHMHDMRRGPGFRSLWLADIIRCVVSRRQMRNSVLCAYLLERTHVRERRSTLMHVICSRFRGVLASLPRCLVASLPRCLAPKAGWLGPRAFQATLSACCSVHTLAPLKYVHVCGLATGWFACT